MLIIRMDLNTFYEKHINLLNELSFEMLGKKKIN